MTDALKTHVLASGRSVFKGDTGLYERGFEVGDRPFVADAQQPVYVAFDAESAKQYGVVLEFTVSEPLVLVELTDAATMEALHASAPADVQTVLEENFGYGASGKRVSEHAADNRLATYLCSMGYDGYALTSQMETEWYAFHEEAAICRKQDQLVIKGVASSADEIAYTRINRMDKESRRQSLREARSSKKAKPGPGSSGLSGLSQRLFGGRKRTRRQGRRQGRQARKTAKKTGSRRRSG